MNLACCCIIWRMVSSLRSVTPRRGISRWTRYMRVHVTTSIGWSGLWMSVMRSITCASFWWWLWGGTLPKNGMYQLRTGSLISYGYWIDGAVKEEGSVNMRSSSIPWAMCDNIIGVDNGTNTSLVPECCRSGNYDWSLTVRFGGMYMTFSV